MTVQMLPARALLRHRMLLSCSEQTSAAATQCLGLSEKLVCGMWPCQAYMTVALGDPIR